MDTVNLEGFFVCLKTRSCDSRPKQEKPTNCGTKAADVLVNFVAGKL